MKKICSFLVLLTFIKIVSGDANVEILLREEFYGAEPVVPRLDGRIVGGSPVNITDYPHQVSFQSWHSHNCGGSLISAYWIVTAAHCVNAGFHRYIFRLGSSEWATGGTLAVAVNIIRHPQYDSSVYDYDVAVVKLSTYQGDAEDNIKYIQLPPDGWLPTSGSLATVTGWGTLYYGGSISDKLQAVDVPIMSNEECQGYYSAISEQYGLYITDRMICAGFATGGYDACSGDSGGPLTMDGYLVGIVSWGTGCAEAGYPGVYSNVTSLLSWIKETTDLS